ncbi:MAG: hypothetical protein GX542_01195 [Rhodococcus sp.]|nr:hypothetical protein [Rhodococcus sp. (in: high G+C Gram-positive bacteria)]
MSTATTPPHAGHVENATTERPTPQAHAAGSSITGWPLALRLILRLERILLSVWIISTTLLFAGLGMGISSLYPTVADRLSYSIATANIVASHALNGPPVGLTSIGGIAVFEAGWYIALGVAALNIVLVARNSRGTEELGRLELLRAGVFGVHANLVALLCVVLLANIAVGSGAALALIATGSTATGSIVFGAALATIGVTFAAITALAAQVSERVRGTYAISFAVLGVAFALRAIGDAGSVPFVSWLSPLGWAQAAHAFADNRWWPLLFAWSVSAILIAAALVLESRRDLEAGLIRPKPGPSVGSPRLASSWALSWRTYRGPVIGWTAAGLGIGAAFGIIGADAEEMANASTAMLDLMGGFTTGDIVDSYFAMSGLFIAILASAGVLVALLRTRLEEDSGRADLVLSVPLLRRQWLASYVGVAALTGALVLLFGGLGLGGAHALRTGEVGAISEMVLAALAHLPAVLLFLALTIALFGLAPTWTPAVWALFAWSAVATLLGPALQLPSAVQASSVLEHTPRLPGTAVLGAVGGGASTSVVALGLLGAIIIVATALGFVGFSRRDVR